VVICSRSAGAAHGCVGSALTNGIEDRSDGDSIETSQDGVSRTVAMRTLFMNTSLPDLTRDSEDLYLRILAKVPALSVLMESAEWLDFMPPDLGQMRTYTDRPHCRPHPERTCINEKLKLPDSVLHAIRDKATSIFAALPEDDEKLPEKKELLIRLASDPAWLELYKHKLVRDKPTEQFVHRPSFVNIGYAHTVRLTVAEVRQQIHESIVEIPEEEIQEFIYQLSKRILLPWPEEPRDPVVRQDLAVRYLFHHAYLGAIADSSVLTTEEIGCNFIDRAETAQTLREQAEKLRSFGMERDAKELMRIAHACSYIPDVLYNRWLVSRNRSPSRLRGYIITLAELNKRLFGSVLRGTIASIANVALDLKDSERITDKQVREMLRESERRMGGRSHLRWFPWRGGIRLR
jgi:hypothetical protein